MTRLKKIDLGALSGVERRALFSRMAVPDRRIRDDATSICDDVASRGDQAMAEYAERFGGGFRRVTESELESAVEAVGPVIVGAIETAITNVEKYHRAQLPTDIQVTTVPGVRIDRKWTPLSRVGCYAPGGKAAYPSTVIMTVVPARVAGVDQIVVVSPSGADGDANAAFLATCRLTGATEVWTMGGAQAVAALAYGTESVEKVQKIVGPGNSWVTAAKLAVYGVCAIDLPAGPSEVLVLADETSDPRLVAVDLLCQAEHGPDSPAVLVTSDPSLPEKVERELDALLPALERAPILEQALADHGWAIITPDHSTSIEVANEYAGEHVTIMTSDPESDAKQIHAAGSVYVGKWAPESAGDYASGANHVLPTGGLAAACGPLSVDDFGSWRQEQRITKEGLRTLTPTISTLATAEGLTAHRLAAEIRIQIQDKETSE